MDQNWDMDFIYNGPIDNRVSCTLGQFDAVAVCNMVGDQPFFYIDDSADAEDMALLDDFFAEDGGAHLHDEALIESLRSRVEAYDRSAESLKTMEVEPTTTLFDRAFSSDIQKINLDDVMAVASQSGMFRSYLEILTKHGVTVHLDEKTPRADYSRSERIIAVNPYLSTNKAVFALAKSMRLAWQHLQGTLMNPLRFQPEDAIVMNRLIAADQDVAGIAVAWELRLAGQTGLWNSLMTGADYDLCSAYAMESMTNFRSISSGLAARATFEKWFISGRCKSLDRTIIQLMLANNTDFIFEDEDISRMIAADSIAKMGARPLGKNYLTPIVTQIMVDGLYTDVRDRANANFLWFIQFEKKMSETEQKLQEGGELSPAVSGATEKGLLDDRTNIATFPSRKSRGASTLSDDGMGADVYYIDHFRAF